MPTWRTLRYRTALAAYTLLLGLIAYSLLHLALHLDIDVVKLIALLLFLPGVIILEFRYRRSSPLCDPHQE